MNPQPAWHPDTSSLQAYVDAVKNGSFPVNAIHAW